SSDLAAARAAVDLMQRNTRDLSAQARAGTDAAARQGQALEEQRRTAEALARDLEAARRTIEVHREIFAREGLAEAFGRVIAVVVQPGVEFGSENVIAYRPEAS
ncbi:class II D-tagatose-bisphosphate aldolase, non-catalytic subunit, partial [Mesorhizobium sp. M8A.F.Ca.ET.165.01.1.1]|uniref:class II D-tagatose-bisphosphate aldolase non-catalytic subunit n=1 Tax=Mesorhizobium sp. M8A.F.Ca.ET.165.01.1.1 TaxID=2563960 RepID=UPI00113CE132